MNHRRVPQVDFREANDNGSELRWCAEYELDVGFEGKTERGLNSGHVAVVEEGSY